MSLEMTILPYREDFNERRYMILMTTNMGMPHYVDKDMNSY